MPSEKVLPARLNMDLIRQLQTVVAPEIFTPRAVYDGRKNLFAVRELPFPEGSKEVRLFISLLSLCSSLFQFDVALVDKMSEAAASANPNAKGPKIYKIRLTKAAEINPEFVLCSIFFCSLNRSFFRTLARFIQGQQSHDNSVLTAITV